MFELSIDIRKILDLEKLPDHLKDIAKDLEEQVAQRAYAHVVELVNQRLHTRKQTYLDALSVKKDSDKTSIILDEKAGWIEDGQDPFNLIPGAIKSAKAKVSRAGNKYLVVPINKGSTSAGSSLLSTLKSESALLNQSDNKNSSAFDSVLQKTVKGNSYDSLKKSKQSVLSHSVYQKKTKATQAPVSKASQFRTISEKAKPPSWDHPGNEPVGLMKETEEWLEKQVDELVGKAIEKL